MGETDTEEYFMLSDTLLGAVGIPVFNFVLFTQNSLLFWTQHE